MLKIMLVCLGISSLFISNLLGSALVYLVKRTNEKFSACLMGVVGGVMVAASIFGLIVPAIEQADGARVLTIFTYLGIVLGALFIVCLDRISTKLHRGAQNRKTSRLFVAITLHNLPEGLSVGLAFGCAMAVGEMWAYLSAMSLAIGIAIQNVPESLAVSLALRTDCGKHKAFLFGTLSGAVEPVMAVLGLFVASQLTSIMPVFLTFAAGAMLLVTISDVLPDTDADKERAGVLFVVGFVLMIVLESLL